jgi:septal ring factor EnvC (AmiA/AmiB activator)
MTALTSAAPVPAQISVDMLLGITSALAKLDAKFDVKFAAVEASIAHLTSDVTSLKMDVAVLKTDVAVLKTDVAVLKADVAELKTDVTVLKADVTVLKVDVSGLKAGAKIMEGDLRKLLDWKQRVWGMLLLVGLATTVAPSVWNAVVELFHKKGVASASLEPVQ